MKAVVAQKLSGPSGLAFTEVPDLVTGGELVVVDVRAAGVCFPDLLLMRGKYQMKVPPPFVPGMETAGVVRYAPPGSGFAIGDRVSSFGGLGGYAEQVAVPPSNVVRSPEGLNDAEAVSLLVNYHAMYFALVRRAALQPGETALVLGSAGGVGTAAIQVAKALGARVIALVHRQGATDFVSSVGADVVLPLTEGGGVAVREQTDGKGVDVGVDPVGGSVFNDALSTLAEGGRLLVIGFAAGGIPTMSPSRLVLRNVGVFGVGWGEFVRRNPGVRAEIGAGIGTLVAAGMKPPPPVRYPLSEGRAALESLASGGVFGKVVLEPK